MCINTLNFDKLLSERREIMNQEKVGAFIASRRKLHKLTQEQLASKLGISDRAVSKWERGLNMPDASLMLELANILDITVNELLSGKIITNENYMNKAEENLIELREREEIANKKLLNLEIVIGLLTTLTFISLILIASIIKMEKVGVILLVVLAICIFLIGIITAMSIERKVGYYECSKCHHRYIPTQKQMWLSAHMLRTRHMRCPKCHEKSWNKKVLCK